MFILEHNEVCMYIYIYIYICYRRSLTELSKLAPENGLSKHCYPREPTHFQRSFACDKNIPFGNASSYTQGSG